MNLYRRIAAVIAAITLALVGLTPYTAGADRPDQLPPEVVAYLKAMHAASKTAAPVTPADTIHPNIHQNNGPGQNANPNGANAGGGNMHGIGNNPGQSGADPADGEPGFADQLKTVHGGIGAVNRNAG